jgi:pimeloyl-ACP methyl ester carboxylesterase
MKTLPASPAANTSENALTAQTQFLESHGRKIAFRSVGAGAPLVLCNRFRGNLDTWDPAFIDALAAHFRVIYFDSSGLGRSTGKPPSDILSMANDARDLIDGLGLGKVVLGGWSLGGLAAQVLATERPDLLTHLIVIGSGPPGKTEHAPEAIFFEAAHHEVNDLADEYVLFFEPKSERSREAAKESHDRIAQRTADLDLTIPSPLWPGLHHAGAEFFADKYGTLEKLKQARIPILLICGDHDVVFPVENWFALNRQLPTAQIVVFPQTGHGPQHQHPATSVGYIETFVRTTH